MKYHILNSHVGREVFIVGVDGEQEEDGEISCFESLSELNDHLSGLSPVSEDNLIVLHGVLAPAEYIPPDVGRGAFVVVADPADDIGGSILNLEDSNIENLASTIEKLLSHLSPYDGLEIDNVFVLYGYELNLGFCVREDEIDEEIFDQSEKVATLVEEMERRNSEGESS